ncbi:hypothetical protein BAE44_0022106, partial [Dichanthelium oligosanthes]
LFEHSQLWSFLLLLDDWYTNQGVWSGLGEKGAWELSKSVVSLALSDGDYALIEVRREGKVATGYLEECDLHLEIAVIKIKSSFNVHAVFLYHRYQFMPYCDVVSLGRDTSGKLMAITGTLVIQADPKRVNILCSLLVNYLRVGENLTDDTHYSQPEGAPNKDHLEVLGYPRPIGKLLCQGDARFFACSEIFIDWDDKCRDNECQTILSSACLIRNSDYPYDGDDKIVEGLRVGAPSYFVILVSPKVLLTAHYIICRLKLYFQARNREKGH